MGSVARRLGWLIPLLLAVVGLLWPLVITAHPRAGAAVADPVEFSSYRADFNVAADGMMQASETITAEFPGGRHGIFRYFDVANANDAHVRQVPEIDEITMDGRPAPYTVFWQDADRFRVAKIGDPGSYVGAGTHVYRIRYRIPGVLDPGTAGRDRQFASTVGAPGGPSAFFWNVIAPGWSNVIRDAEITVRLPGPVPGAQCSVGMGEGSPCPGLAVDGDTIAIRAPNLDPRTPVTVRAGVDVATPPRAGLPWSVRGDPVLGRSLPTTLWLLGLTLASGLGAVLLWRSTVEPAPGFPLQYAPPPGLGPVQCEYIRTEKVPDHGVTATLFSLADRGLVTLNEVGPKKWAVSAERQFDSAVGQVLALGQTYPQLSSSANFLDLQRNLADSEDKLAFARQYYNDAAATVNRLRSTIPWMFIAGMAGVGEREFYQASK